MHAADPVPVPAVGVVCLKGDHVLLIKRARAPLAGHWSLPGGRIAWGERAHLAGLRELHEETGVTVELVGLIDVVDGLFLEGPAARHYVLIDYAARWIAGEPRPGDDAAEARFFSPEELGELGLWDETLRIIAAARALCA